MNAAKNIYALAYSENGDVALTIFEEEKSCCVTLNKCCAKQLSTLLVKTYDGVDNDGLATLSFT